MRVPPYMRVPPALAARGLLTIIWGPKRGSRHLAPLGHYRKWAHRNPASSPASPMALVSSHGWFGILGTGWRCVAWPRRHAEIMERKRDAASMPVHRSQTAPDSTPIWRDYSCRSSPISEAGIYPLPFDHDGSLLTLIHRSRPFFADLPEIHRRHEVRGHSSIKIRAVRGRATICRISTINPAAGDAIKMPSGLLQLFPQNYHEPYYEVIQRKISEHSLWRVALPMCEASWPSFLRLWFSQRHKPVRGATVSVAAPKNSEVNGAFHTTRRTQVKSVSSSYGFAIDFGVRACLDRSQL